MSNPKVFQIGFNKCATRSLAQFFELNGYKSAHCLSGRLARSILNAKAKGHCPLEKWSEVTFFCDMEAVALDKVCEGYREFAYLDQWYPDALFILNTRRVNDWLTSRAVHDSGVYLRHYMYLYGTDDPILVLQKWKEAWHSHLVAVRAYFADKPGRLLEFDIDHDKPEALVSFFEGRLSLSPEHWGHWGETTLAS